MSHSTHYRSFYGRIFLPGYLPGVATPVLFKYFAAIGLVGHQSSKKPVCRSDDPTNSVIALKDDG